MNWQLHSLAGWFFGGVAVLWVAGMVLIYAFAERPAEGRVAIIFPPSMGDEPAIAAIIRAGARPIGQGWVRWVWAADLDTATPEKLQMAGALVVVRDFPFVVALGCAGGFSGSNIARAVRAPPR